MTSFTKNFEIKTALAFTGKDLWTAIRKDKHFKHVIQEQSNTNQWGIYSLNYYYEIKCVQIIQAAPIGELPVEIPLKKVGELAVRVGPPQEGNVQKMNFTSETVDLVSK